VSYDKWENKLRQVVEGLEFRSVTITAVKPQDQLCIDKGQAVIYRGPYSEIYDDEGHVYLRGQCMAICERNFKLHTSETYNNDFIGIASANEREGKP
jgi:arsenite methyltransferase